MVLQCKLRPVILTIAVLIVPAKSPAEDLEVLGCDPNGRFILDMPVQYICAFGAFNETFSSFTFEVDASMLFTIARGEPDPNVDLVDFIPVNCPSGSFDFTGVIVGACQVSYKLVGAFSTEDTWDAGFNIEFSGSCFDCSNQLFFFSAQRQTELIFANGYEEIAP